MPRRTSNRRIRIDGYEPRSPRRRRSLAKLAIVVTSIVLCGMALVDTGHAAEHSKLFGTNEVRSTDISAFSKWTDVLTRHAEEVNWAEEDCIRGQQAACQMGVWIDFLTALNPTELVAALVEIGRAHV